MSRRFAWPLALACAIALGAGCGRGGGGDAPSAAICPTTSVVRAHLLDGRTFAELVDLPHEDQSFKSSAAAIALSPARLQAQSGPYAPMVRYLAAVAKDDAGQRTEVPPLDDSVRRSARRLDRDLERGLCDE